MPLYFAQVAVSASAPNPNAARLAANFMLSRDCQVFYTKFGRLPTRGDVETNPPGIIKQVEARKVVRTQFSQEEEKRLRQTFDDAAAEALVRSRVSAQLGVLPASSEVGAAGVRGIEPSDPLTRCSLADTLASGRVLRCALVLHASSAATGRRHVTVCQSCGLCYGAVTLVQTAENQQGGWGGLLNNACRLGALAAVALSLGLAPAAGQDAKRPWLDPTLLAAAQKEGPLVVYSSMNEQEGLPLFKIFTEATGIKVNYVRAADTPLMGRIAIEFRTKQKAWDILQTTTINKVPPPMMAQIDPPEAKDAQARGARLRTAAGTACTPTTTGRPTTPSW